MAQICVLRAEASSAGVALMSQLLQAASPRHLTVDLLKSIEGLCRAAPACGGAVAGRPGAAAAEPAAVEQG